MTNFRKKEKGEFTILPRSIWYYEWTKFQVLGAGVSFLDETQEFILVERIPRIPYDHFQRIVPKEFFMKNFKQVAGIYKKEE